MGVRRLIGYVINLLFGLLFPYTLAGCVILIYGFMTPSGTIDKMIGFGIAAVYLGVLAVLNWALVKGETGRSRWKAVALNVGIWLVVSLAATFILSRGGNPFQQ